MTARVSEPVISLEFFPPRDLAAQERLVRTAKQLMALNPGYVSVTFGAGGATRDGTAETVRIMENLGCDVAPHLACIGSSRAELAAMLAAYREQGVKRVVALRGDLPSGMGSVYGEFRYASELVAFIREAMGDWFHIEVAAYPEMHPQAESLTRDMDHFVEKVRAGADSAITQYFFNPDAYSDFVERAQARGVDIPIIPGIMPIVNNTQLTRFSQMCGAEIPRWLRLRLNDYADDRESLRAFGADVVAQLCQTLLERGAPGLHFYTLNGSEAVRNIWRRLNPGVL
ncbi:methylenetetrahydrofolate reductase [NAD(P)H] [Kerstersia similis]|uniref:methylenetetrahydrofolate reductase [NAD(P)H] n=1 Tax=Kerstersia similis TaxID=206505 RepID=UPI0039EFF04E